MFPSLSYANCADVESILRHLFQLANFVAKPGCFFILLCCHGVVQLLAELLKLTSALDLLARSARHLPRVGGAALDAPEERVQPRCETFIAMRATEPTNLRKLLVRHATHITAQRSRSLCGISWRCFHVQQSAEQVVEVDRLHRLGY